MKTRRDEKPADNAVLAAVTKMLRTRIKGMGDSLKKADFAEHLRSDAYLDEGTVAQAYWHAGYVAAMKDALRMIDNGTTEWPAEVTYPESRSA